jgi:hypothetical protein
MSTKEPEREERAKRLPGGGMSKPISFVLNVKQRECFDELLEKTKRTHASLMREAVEVFLVKHGYSRKEQGLEE